MGPIKTRFYFFRRFSGTWRVFSPRFSHFRCRKKTSKIEKTRFSLSRPFWARQRIRKNRRFFHFSLILSFRLGARCNCITKVHFRHNSVADSISHQCAVVGPSFVAICSSSIDSRFPLPSDRSRTQPHGPASSIVAVLSTQYAAYLFLV
jgi:hypothetical protein